MTPGNRRHRTSWRLAFAIFLVGASLATVPVAATAAPLTPSGSVSAALMAAEVNTNDADPVARFGACLLAGGQGDLLMLIDESGSLQQTDRANSRVKAVRYLLGQLSSFVDTAHVKVNVRLAAFADKYEALSDWTALGSANLSGLQSIGDSLAARNHGFDTDYWTALESARRDLAVQKAARATTPSCQTIAWFTDGQLDFEPRRNSAQRSQYPNKSYAPDIAITSSAAAARVAAIATNLICTPGGLADQLRSSGVEMFAVGLQSGNLDFSLLKSIATGPGCGSIVTPAPGIFTTASDIDSLLFAFDALSSPGDSPIQTTTGICQISICPEETHRFVLDQSTSTVHVLASAEIGGLNISLISPSGQAIALEPRTVDQKSTARTPYATASYTWHSDKTVSIDITEVAAKDWTGLWQLAFVDPTGTSAGKKSFSNVRISSDFVPVIVKPAPDQWHRGDQFAVILGVADASGKPVATSGLLGGLRLFAQLTDAGGKTIDLASDLDKNTISTPINVNLSGVAIGTATLKLDLVHTTAPVLAADGSVAQPGTQLQPKSVEIPIPVGPPLNFPVIASSANFGVLDGRTAAHLTIPFTGNGCVWLDAQSAKLLAGPSAAGKIAISSPKASSSKQCLAGGSLPVDFTAGSSANGTVNGTVTVMISPKNDLQRAIPVTVAFTADMRKPISTVNFVTSLLAALILGPGIPLGLVYFLKFLIAKIPSRALSSERIRVSVVDGRVTRDGVTFALRDTDFRDLTGIKPGGERRLEVAGVTLSTRIGKWPSSAGYVVVSAPGMVSASDQTPAWISKVPSARLPLAVHNHWIVLRSHGAPASEAEVVLFVSGDADMERKQRLIENINDRLPELLERLIEVSGDDPPAESTDSWDRVSSSGSGFDMDLNAPSGSNSSSGFGFADD